MTHYTPITVLDNVLETECFQNCGYSSKRNYKGKYDKTYIDG